MVWIDKMPTLCLLTLSIESCVRSQSFGYHVYFKKKIMLPPIYEPYVYNDRSNRGEFSVQSENAGFESYIDFKKLT